MTIAGQLTVTASDDPRFAAGDSIGVVIDAGLELTVTQAVEVSAPAAAVPPVSTETASPEESVSSGTPPATA